MLQVRGYTWVSGEILHILELKCLFPTICAQLGAEAAFVLIKNFQYWSLPL